MPHAEHFNLRKLRTLYSLSFFFAIATAAVAYSESSFLETFIAKESVGLVFVASYLVALVLLARLDRVIARLGKQHTTLALMFLSLVALFILAYTKNPFVLIPTFVVYIATLVAAWVSLDILIETFSSDVLTGRIRGTQLTIMNAGWVVTPVVAGFILETYGFPRVFTIAFGVTLLVFAIVFFGFRKIEHEHIRPHGFFSTLRAIARHRSLSHIFIIAFLLQFFYAWMVIYTPLYLLSIGIEWSDIGKIFSFMLLPFVLFQYPAGWLADKWGSERGILITGLTIIALATSTLFFVHTSTLWIWALLLFTTRIGASLIEIMRDTYFFKQVDKRDVHLIDFFRNMGPLGYMTAPLVATAILSVTGIQSLFLVLGVLMLGGIVIAARIPIAK
ncbi:MAG: MFS transporter [bacterium]|nr:MFS transporter [bacterium]